MCPEILKKGIFIIPVQSRKQCSFGTPNPQVDLRTFSLECVMVACTLGSHCPLYLVQPGTQDVTFCTYPQTVKGPSPLLVAHLLPAMGCGSVAMPACCRNAYTVFHCLYYQSHEGKGSAVRGRIEKVQAFTSLFLCNYHGGNGCPSFNHFPCGFIVCFKQEESKGGCKYFISLHSAE